MDLLSAHYAAPSLLFCERGMQDLHLKASAPEHGMAALTSLTS